MASYASTSQEPKQYWSWGLRTTHMYEAVIVGPHNDRQYRPPGVAEVVAGSLEVELGTPGGMSVSRGRTCSCLVVLCVMME